MLKSLRVGAVLWAAIVASSSALAQSPAPTAAPAPGGAPSAEETQSAKDLLAERFFELAMRNPNNVVWTRPMMEQSAVLLDAACRTSPTTARYYPALARMRMKLGDVDGAIDAWVRYRAPNVQPGDEVAQINLINLYLSRLQANEAKLKYLNALLGKESVPTRVKAHIAMRAVPLLNERSRTEALAMLARARAFYPLPEVVLMEEQMLPADATVAQRFGAVLAILRANPTNTDALAKAANILASVGLSEQALTWYTVLVEIHNSRGTEADEATMINYLAERYRAGEYTVAADQLDSILLKYPTFLEGWKLRLTVARGDESPAMLSKARDIFTDQLKQMCSRIVASIPATTTKPTSQPSSLTLDAARRVINLEDVRVRNALIASLADLAWFEIYFDHKPELAVEPIAAMKELLPPNEALLQRLQGWYSLVTEADKEKPETRKILTPLRAVDPLAAMGLFKIDDLAGHTTQATTIAGDILSEPQTGVLGAILWQATKGRGIKPTTRPAAFNGIKEQLDKFPSEWIQVARRSDRIYSLRAEPIQVGHRVGDPLIAIFQIQNTSQIDITIGDYGLIRPQFVFEAQIRDVNHQPVFIADAEPILGQQVLAPGDSITQYFRVDRADLTEGLRVRPAVALRVVADVITNPTPAGNNFRPTSGGRPANFGKMFLRTQYVIREDKDRRKIVADLNNAPPVDKMLDVEILSAYVMQFSDPAAKLEDRAFSQLYVNTIDKMRVDPSPEVRLWASYDLAILKVGPEEEQLIEEMTNSPAWEMRLLGLASSRYLSTEALLKIANKLASDPDKGIRQYAAALAQQARNPTTRPAEIAPAEPPKKP